MTPDPTSAVATGTEEDPWLALRRFTHARIALGRSGDGLPTQALLAFQLAHAQARDAVHATLDVNALESALRHAGYPTLQAHSAAQDRAEYLRRPDLGRRLDSASAAALDAYALQQEAAPDLVFVVADGLSAYAAANHALPLLSAVQTQLPELRLGPIVIAQQARVALGDDIGERLQARLVAVLLGERPGLSSPDSLGIYLTYNPHRGCSDAQRNCISNVRPQGLAYAAAAFKLCYLLSRAFELGLTGIGLKDDSDRLTHQAESAQPHPGMPLPT